MVPEPEELRRRILGCKPGRDGWREFESTLLVALTWLFVPPLHQPMEQARTFSGIDRRDAVFPNRNRGVDNHWGKLIAELDARMVLVEFKNYDTDEIGKDEVNQTRNYLTSPMGRLALLVSNKPPNDAAHIKRNAIYSEEGKVILFLSIEQVCEMLFMKERGEDPADLVMDLIEQFYVQHE